VLISIQMKDFIKVASFEGQKEQEEQEDEEKEELDLDMDLEIDHIEGAAWDIVRSKNYNFEILIPSEYTLNEVYYQDKTIVSSQCYKSEMRRIYVDINEKDSTPDDCLKEKYSLPISDKEYLEKLSLQLTEKGWPEKREVNGFNFYRRYSADSAMGGKSMDYLSYQTFYDNKCYVVGIDVYSSHAFGLVDDCPNSLTDSYEHKSLLEQENKRIKDIFFPILSTFKFVK